MPLAPLRGSTREVVVWNSVVPARDAGDEAAAWLSSALGSDVRLVRFDPAHQRLCNPVYAGDSGAHTAFADGYPLLVIGEASLEDLNRRLEDKGAPALPMNRFRPNIVLAGLEPTTRTMSTRYRRRRGDEDRQAVRTLPDHDHRPGLRPVGVEPLRTLGGYRMDERAGGVTFGMNAIIVAGEGRTLSVGTDIEASFAF